MMLFDESNGNIPESGEIPPAPGQADVFNQDPNDSIDMANKYRAGGIESLSAENGFSTEQFLAAKNNTDRAQELEADAAALKARQRIAGIQVETPENDQKS